VIDVHQFPVLKDNYAFLVRCRATGAVATIDTPDGGAILAEAARLGWTITDIWNTHWHPDHAGGNAAIIAATNARVTGPAEVAKIAAMPDHVVAGGETVRLGQAPAQVIDVGGHTLGHVAFWFEGAQTAFVGDTIFALGCGRLFEGTAEQMWKSLQRLMDLPDETTLYCAHEYTESNLRYALHVDPANAELQARGEVIARLRATGLATVPMTLAQEKATNPFLRAGGARRFGDLRAGKDGFKG
jgi:hydroxyacylglutathione hydrolase